MIFKRAAGPRSSARSGRVKASQQNIDRLNDLGAALFSEGEAAQALDTTSEGLAELFGRSPRARKSYHDARAKALEALRLAQFKHAQTNASMALFLGRIHLSEVESREAGHGEPFDVSGASQRLRDKLAVIAAAANSSGDG